MSKKPTESSRGFLENLFSAFEEAPAANEETLQQSLSESGIDSGLVLSQCTELVRRLYGQQRLLAARAKLDRVRKAVVRLGDLSAGLSEKTKEELAQALAGMQSGALVQAYFRKLEAVAPETLTSLKEDLGLIEFLEQIEKEDG